MRKVKVRSAGGQEIEMIAVDESARLVYVVSPDSLARLESGLTEAVGCPKIDVKYQYDMNIPS